MQTPRSPANAVPENLKKQNDMKKILSKFWLRCAIVFILLLALNGTRWRLFPGDDPEGSNLLVNVVLAGAVTLIYALADKCWCQIRRHRQEVKRIFKQQ